MKFKWKCPSCSTESSFTLERLKKGMCPNDVCRATLTPKQREEIAKGIEASKRKRELIQVDSVMRKGKK
jgi:hypothetical protein